MVLLCQNNERWCMIKLILLIQLLQIVQSCSTLNVKKLSPLDRELKTYVDKIAKTDNYKILPGVSVKRDQNVSLDRLNEKNCRKNDKNVNDYFKEKLLKYALGHYVNVNVRETAARFFKPVELGKSSFLAGFGMGFLAKLLLPLFVGAQIVKSVLLALFLPSIVGNLGKLLGKGLSSFSGNSGASGAAHAADQMEDFEFKDTSPYNTEGETQEGFDAGNNIRLNVAGTEKPEAANRFGYGNKMFNTMPQSSDSYYFRKPVVKMDFKVFHKIPPSSLLLTSYDPFYSPLLSRLDVVFQRLGLGNDKSTGTERCRERLVCMMYANPAKYAPYSNLVSAQLSRELNELRRPSSDNPEILRFFRYMKAAKDGQDGEECLLHGGCPSLMAHRPSPAMLTTYNDINKLVQARKIN